MQKMLKAEISFTFLRRPKRPTVTAAFPFLCAVILIGVAGIGAGCSKTNTSSAPATGAGKGPSDAAPGAVKLTPAQEAAKQKAIEQGPAIQAAAQEGQSPR